MRKSSGRCWQACSEHFDTFRVLLLPDHPTPLALKTHVREPVPIALYGRVSSRMPDRVSMNRCGRRARWMYNKGPS